MGRYKRAIGSRNYCNYNNAKLEEAVRLIKCGAMSQRLASERYKIPRSTLQNKVKKVHNKTPGGQTILSLEEERKIEAHILVTSTYGFPLDCLDLRKLVKGYLDRKGVVIRRFTNNLPGPEWVRLYLKRHPVLTQRFAANIKSVRAAISIDVINTYFDNLERELEGVPPENIWNYDESNLSDDPGNKKVITKRGCKYPERILNSSKQSTSVMFCGNALGTVLPPYVVYKAKNMYDTWMEGGPDGTRYNRSKSGWFEGPIFEDWFENLLLPALRHLEGTKVLIGDNLSSHLSSHVLDLCSQNDIKFICLPPNTTHISQPLDIAYFRPLKMKWRQIITNYKLSGANNTIPKSVFPRLLKLLTDALLEPGKENLISGFEKAGIYPVNRVKILERIPSNENLDPNVQVNVSASVIDLLEERRFAGAGEQTLRKKKVSVIPGRSISIGDIKKQPVAGPSEVKKNKSSCPTKKTRTMSSDSDSSINISLQSEEDQDLRELESENEDTQEDTRTECNNELKIGKFVLFLFEKKIYPGKIVDILQEKVKQYKIKSLAASGLFQWKWPTPDDIIWYAEEEILQVIETPIPSKRGFFRIPEIEKCHSS